MPVGDESAQDQAGAEHASAGRIAASVGLALVGFLLTAGLLHASIRDPLHLHADARSEKLAMLETWHGKVFSAVFGSSHVHNGFDPRAFDADLAGSPEATHTANLAVVGGSQAEQYVMAEQFVRQLESPAQVGAAAQPCMVILELTAGANFTPDHLVHPRAINIYDWRTAQLTQDFVAPSMSKGQRYGRVGFAWAAMGLHYINVGMLSSTIFAPPLSTQIMQEQTQDDRRGLMVLPYDGAYQGKLHELIDSLPKQPVIATGETMAGSAELVEHLAADAAVKHVTFAYVVMPKLTDLGGRVDYPDHLTVAGPRGPIDVPILNLGRADLHPEMYDPNLWYDDSHLTGSGAAVASKILAEEMKRWYGLHGAAAVCGA